MIQKQNIKGLTLVELVIVIFVIILLLILVPFPQRHTRNQARRTVCLSNQKQIAMAFIIYANDNDDDLISADTFVNEDNTNWVSGPLNKERQPVDWNNCSQENEIRGIQQSLLYKYIQLDEIFNCCSVDDKKFTNSPLGYRSYSIPSTLNGTDMPEEMEKYRYTKIDQIKNAAETFMLVEEADTRGFNYNGWFQNPEKPDTIVDSIGIFHKKSSNFGFCDGHVENIKWENPKTTNHFENYIENNTDGSFNFTNPENKDIQLIHKYYPARDSLD